MQQKNVRNYITMQKKSTEKSVNYHKTINVRCLKFLQVSIITIFELHIKFAFSLKVNYKLLYKIRLQRKYY